MEYTSVVCLKSGLACVAIFGESSDFLEKSFFAKFQKSGFLENHCISYSLYDIVYIIKSKVYFVEEATDHKVQKG